MRKTLSLAVLVCLGGVSVARAGDLNPNTQSGVAIDQAFAAGGVDHINLFNGSLTVAIPLGQPFRVGDHLSYGFTVVYGSNPWSVQPNGDSIPSPCANIALGWRLTFGQIIPSNFNGQTCGAPPSPTEVYEGPDGSAHQFFTALHEGDVAIPGVLYTRDGSYLRLLYLNPGYQLEFPDGTFHTFDAAGRIQTMQDRFGNSVTITMAPTVWTITDSYHRTATVFFVTTQTGVITVNLPAFGGATATYTLTTTAGNLWPSCPSSSPSHSFPVQLLTQIQFPDQSSYSIGAGDYIQTPPVSPAVCTPFSASLLGLNLRTGGRVEWQYATYSFPTEPFAKLHAGRTSNPGVTRRTLKDRNGTLTDPLCVGPPINGVPSCYWTYVQAAFSGAPMETITTVTDPYGSSTRNYFSVAFDTLSGGDPAAYGAPISQASHPQAPPQVVGGVTEYLSTESQDRSGAVVRREYLAFDHDALSTAALADSVGTAAANANRRIQQGRTVFVDDAGRYRDTIFTNFDQLGHYRVVKMSDNFGFGTQRTETTGWSPGGQPAANQSWILNTYAFTEQQEGDAVEHQEPVFEVATGFLLCTRRFKSGAQRGIHDVVVSYAHSDTTALGQVSSENWYGGDTRRISTTSNCPTGTDTPAYTYNHSYTVGVRMLTSVQVDDGTGTNHYNQLNLLDLTIDPSTGLPSSSRDPAGRPTSFTYDLLGRRVTVSPQGDATATTVYNINDPTSPFVDSVVGSGTPLEHRTWRLDALGRTARHEVTLPGGVVSNTFSSSNPMGWRTFVSESTSAAGGPGSTYLYYNPSDPRGVVPDPFGRPAEVDAADGKKTQFGYLGARVLTRSNRVQQQLQVPDAQGHPVWKTAEVWATNEETYDGLGRLRQIKDPNGTLTRYYYDVGGRLGTVISGGQTRSFNYDGRGFLIAERHPESGLTSYRYDARGNVVQESTATGSLFSSYDAASRLRVVSTVGGAVLKEFTYGTPNYYNGKLVSARASNYRSTGACTAYVVQQDLRYDPSHGRLSSEDTTLFQGATLLQKWTQSYVYDGAGRITQTNLPNCVANCTSTPRTVTTNYAFGRPTSIPGFASSITYNGNGTLNTVAHANGVVFTEAPDPSGMARPGSIGVAGSSSPWQPETYAYDGAGNVKQIGNKQYTYDAASRITSATLPSAAPLAPPLGSAPYQELTYDPLGNVTRISRGTQKGSILTYVDYSTDVASNHLQGASYDGSGSMTGYQGSVYTWDVLRQATTVNTGSESWVHIYDVAGERVWSWRTSSSRLDNYALRGQDGRVLRFFANNGSTLTWEDYVYREGDLVGAVAPDGTPRHFDVDHLGSVRLETGGLTTPYHEYWAYGEEATPPAGSERMKFTGHERDLGVLTSTADDIDYMHARYYRPLLARFLSVDSHGGDPHNPKSWNRYSYTYDNPLKLVDPNGLEPLPTNWRYFFNVFFDADFSGVDVQRGFVAHTLASGEVGAMTIGSTIFLNKDVDASYDAARPASIALIGHELAHVLQYQHLGIRRFLEGYLQNYAYNRAQGQSGFDAYQNIVLEEIARQIQGVLRSFLEQHPEIAAKLASGADFTEAEMKAVSDALAEAASNGTFKYGFQFVQGFLVYVAPPK